ncbi:uncharacterized protein LOC144167036 [Haemaphysalis longicornis]
MVYCAIVGCSSRTQTKKKKTESNSKDPDFFKVPKVRTSECEKTKLLSEKRRREWLARINRPGTMDPDKYRVCSRHFLSGAPAKLFDECSPDWAPSLHLGYEAKPANEGRYNRLKTRRTRSQQGVFAGISCQTDLTSNDIQQLQDVAANLQNELTDVKMELLASKFTEDSLREDDQKVAFYTGLPSFLMLFSLFNLLKDHASHGSRK